MLAKWMLVVGRQSNRLLNMKNLLRVKRPWLFEPTKRNNGRPITILLTV
jgi:hypothetical protein